MEALSSVPAIFLSRPPHARSSFSSSTLPSSLSISSSSPRPFSISDGGVKASNGSGDVFPYANYVVPLENASTMSCITRPLAEILRDLNKKVPDTALQASSDHGVPIKFIPWYHANRMLSFYAPGWCGEVRNILHSADGKTVTVVYRVIIRGSDAEAYRECSGTVRVEHCESGDPVLEAEAIAFQRACARFGLGLYLYHDDDRKQD